MFHRNNGCRFEFVGVGGGPVLLQQYFQYAFICCPSCYIYYYYYYIYSGKKACTEYKINML